MLRILLFALVLVLSSCTGLKTVTEEDPLYLGPVVRINGNGPTERKKDLQSELAAGLRPLPNRVFLRFIRQRLAIYHFARKAKPGANGIMGWLKYKVGEPPVTISKVKLAQNEVLVRQFMIDNGFFNSTIKINVLRKGKKARVEYLIDSGPEYTISEVVYPKSDSLVQSIIRAYAPGSFVKVGDPYSISSLKEERIRLDSMLKNNGFFYFQPDFLLFKADTVNPGNNVRLSLDLKNDIPFDAGKKMQIREVNVSSEFTYKTDTAMFTMDTLDTDGINVLFKGTPPVNPSVISRAVAFRPGKEYKLIDHDLTLSRLASLGLFKFVNIGFVESDTSKNNRKLDCRIHLTPLDKRSIRLELQAVTKSNNFAGPVFSIIYRNRNLFKNAEIFQLNLNTSFQTQIRTDLEPVNNYELSSDAKLFIPKIIAPFGRYKESSRYIPRTRVELGTGIFQRVSFYSMFSVFGNYGYIWRESERKAHELNPIALNYLDLSNRTEKFQELLDKNLLLKSSFEEQFIIGSNYTFTYAKLTSKSPYNYYLMTNIDLSGNTVSLIEKITGQDPFSFAGIDYSQYSRFEADGRYYYDLTRKFRIATKLIAGVGVPYGNSETLPYIKQFFCGGSTSIRAFAPRTVGPGVYSPVFEENLAYFEQGGEMKLESSFELRYSLTKLFKPALFIDAGNVWLLNPDESFPGGEFKPSEFTRQLAIGAGAGLRVDVSVLVLRFDLAFPIQTPNKYRVITTSGNTISDNLGSNAVFNVALGYPF